MNSIRSWWPSTSSGEAAGSNDGMEEEMKRTLIPTSDLDACDDDANEASSPGADREGRGERSDDESESRRRSVSASSVPSEGASASDAAGPTHAHADGVGDGFENDEASASLPRQLPCPLPYHGGNADSPSLAVCLLALCAAFNSCILGYDFGVNALSVLLVQKTLDLSDLQISAYLAALDGFAMLGAATTSFVNDRFGRRGCFVMTSLGFLCGDLLQASARNYAQLMVGRSLLGLAIGWGLAVDPMYISEISPANVRGFLVSWSEIAINVGVIFGFASGMVFYHTPDEYAWRYMYACGAMPAVAMLLLVKCYMPESPRFLLQKGRDDDARRVLARLHSGDEDEARSMAREIQESIAREEAAFHPGWKFLLCKPSPAYRRMLSAGVVAGISQQVVGISAVGSFAIFILNRSGVHNRYQQALTLVGIATMKAIVTFGSSKLLDSWGRRRLSFISIAGIVVSLLVLAADFHLSSGATSGMATVGLLGYMISFAAGMGPVAWLVPSEVFTTSIRAKGTSVCTFSNRSVSMVWSLSFLQLEKAITWSGAFLVLAAASVAMAGLIYVYVPETKGRSLEDMAVYFATLTGDRSVLDHLDGGEGACVGSGGNDDRSKRTMTTTNTSHEII